eukprot:TRINITY_DN2428_c1_g1_i1.p1 TRINITY_DN2428_c1_g1~~TRINITY_DN2428_c1_g1_i1.p1  ORF type:complete len:315 (+),score=121.24 TRINITY_DN2428_c1_g1_i1:89-946(+)
MSDDKKKERETVRLYCTAGAKKFVVIVPPSESFAKTGIRVAKEYEKMYSAPLAQQVSHFTINGYQIDNHSKIGGFAEGGKLEVTIHLGASVAGMDKPATTKKTSSKRKEVEETEKEKPKEEAKEPKKSKKSETKKAAPVDSDSDQDERPKKKAETKKVAATVEDSDSDQDEKPTKKKAEATPEEPKEKKGKRSKKEKKEKKEKSDKNEKKSKEKNEDEDKEKRHHYEWKDEELQLMREQLQHNEKVSVSDVRDALKKEGLWRDGMEYERIRSKMKTLSNQIKKNK